MGQGKGRIQLTFLCCLLAMPTCAMLLDGVHAEGIEQSLLAGAVLGVAYLLLRPILKLLTLPIGCLTLGLFGFVVDAALILLCGEVVPGFTVDGVGWALMAALLVDGMCLVTGGYK